MKANAMGLIGSLENIFAEWKTVREALNCFCVYFSLVYFIISFGLSVDMICLFMFFLNFFLMFIYF